MTQLMNNDFGSGQPQTFQPRTVQPKIGSEFEEFMVEMSGLEKVGVEKSGPVLICTWFLKNQFGNIKFDELFLVYLELNFYCLCSLQKSISKLIFAG